MKARKYRRIIASVYNSVWAIDPHKMEEICELLELRDQGVQLNSEQIKERLAHVRQAETINVPSIAVMNLFGVVSQRMNMMQEYSGGTSTEQFSRAFDEAVQDDNVTGIVINCDSPGGSVPGVKELSDRIYQARGTKKIVTVVSPMCCSAAYWIGSAAEEMVAIPSASDIGSIGVMMVRTDSSKQDEQEGIKRHMITSNEYKGIGHPHKPMSEQEAAHWDERVQQIHTDFVTSVARNRGVSVEVVEEKYGNGRSFLTQEALTRGMIDRVATLEEVLAEFGVSTGGGASSQQATGTTNSRPSVANEKGEFDMNPKLLTALVRAGLIEVGADDTTAQASLNAYFAVQQKEVPGTEDEIIAALKQPPATAITQGNVTPVMSTGVQGDNLVQQVQLVPTQSGANGTTPPAGCSVEDIVSTIQISRLAPAAALELQNTLISERASGNLTIEQVRERISTELQTANPAAGASTIVVQQDEISNFVDGARDALLVRHYGQNRLPEKIFSMEQQNHVDWKPSTTQSRLSSVSMVAERCLEMCGVERQKIDRLHKNDIARIMVGKPLSDFGIMMSSSAYNASGMFANILLSASNVVLRDSYVEAPSTYDLWMKQGESLSDFRLVDKVIGGELSDPQAVPEDGEFEETSMGDAKESYKLTVWGEMFSISWQTIVNDKLNAFLDTPAKQNRAMKRKLNKLAYQQLKDNPVMGDGVRLFNGTAIGSGGHNNLATGVGAPSVANFDLLREKTMMATGINSDTTLGLTPSYVIVPPKLEGTTKQLLRSTADPNGTHSGVANTWQGGLTPIAEPELSALQGGSDTAWYTAADHRDVDTVEYAFLQGLEEPSIDQEVCFNRLSIRSRIYIAFAVKALDWRGLQKHENE